MARVQKQDHSRNQLVLAQACAVAFGDEELADEIVARIAAPHAGKAAHEVGERARRFRRPVLHGAVNAELVHRHHAMRPIDELAPHVARRAEEVGDHRDRNGAGELGDELGRAVLSKCVDPLVRQRRDLRREFFDAARDEGAIDEAPKPRVLGRLELQDRMALKRVERLKMRLRLGPAQFRATHHVQNCRPKRRSRRSADTSRWAAKHQKPYSSQKNTGAALRIAA